MTIQVRFFASLREQLGMEAKQLEVSNEMTVNQVWQLATGQQEIPANTLMAVNMEYVDREQPVGEGDEVAFFPPVTGG
jgi:molybdopterin synthase sulfur carrier subunit